jgi:hypothetical protein
MMKNRMILLGALLCVVFVAVSHAAEVHKVRITDFGLTSITVTGKESDSTAVGQASVGSRVRYIKQSTQVPAVLNTCFGITYVIEGRPVSENITVTVRESFPGLKNPKRDTPVKSLDVTKVRKIGHSYDDGYCFEHEWELVPGSWTFQIMYEGNKLAEKTFTVVKP